MKIGAEEWSTDFSLMQKHDDVLLRGILHDFAAERVWVLLPGGVGEVSVARQALTAYRPRVLQVGDKVRIKTMPGATLEVVATYRNRAWLADYEGTTTQAFINDLERI